MRYLAGVLAAAVALGTMGCSSGTINAQPNSRPYETPAPNQRPGMSTRNKVLLLAGAAAVYYLYQKHKNKQGQGPEGRYFRSKNGRVYYRDMRTGQYQWVDPPQQPIQVPADEYQRYFPGQGAPEGALVRQAPPQWSDPTYR